MNRRMVTYFKAIAVVGCLCCLCSTAFSFEGPISAWGFNYSGQTNVPSPNSGFTAIAAGGAHSLGLKATGACCWGNETCGQVLQLECSYEGDVFYGPGSSCIPNRDGNSMRNGCPVPLLGPCCFGGGICIDATDSEDCQGVNGRYLGDGLSCGDDGDLDGIVGCNDQCPLDRNKGAPGYCGCGVREGDRDSDGVCDAVDPCPLDDPDDSDGDGVCDSADPCPFDKPDDSDGDGVCESEDGCPNDPYKSDPGTCGCGIADDDSDGDAVVDCTDLCSNTSPNVPVNGCGCVAFGACCFSVGVCFNGLQRHVCAAIEGIYQGDGSACSEGCGFGDFDGDGAVDLRDFAAFQHCFGADETDFTDDSCGRGDIDGCQDIDLWDYDAFRRAVIGP